jgi:hypothetical protein
MRVAWYNFEADFNPAQWAAQQLFGLHAGLCWQRAPAGDSCEYLLLHRIGTAYYIDGFGTPTDQELNNVS